MERRKLAKEFANDPDLQDYFGPKTPYSEPNVGEEGFIVRGAFKNLAKEPEIQFQPLSEMTQADENRFFKIEEPIVE